MLDHLRMATRPQWLAFGAFVLVLIVVFLSLGRWQLGRAADQSGTDQLRDAAVSSPVAEVSDVLTVGVAPPPAAQWRLVSATGTYDVTHQLLVRNRTMDGANGYYVLVPLRTEDGTELPVVRGWIPSGGTADAPAAVPEVPVGRITVVGRVRLPEPAASTRSLPAGQVARVVPAELAASTGQPTFGGWIAVESEDPQPTGASVVAHLPDESDGGFRWPISHTVYAWQWFTFAGIALIGAAILLRRDVRQGRAPAERSRSTEV